VDGEQSSYRIVLTRSPWNNTAIVVALVLLPISRIDIDDGLYLQLQPMHHCGFFQNFHIFIYSYWSHSSYFDMISAIQFMGGDPLKKSLTLTLLIFFCLGLGAQFLLGLPEDHVSNESLKIVLNEQLDDPLTNLKNNDHKLFSLVLSIISVDILLSAIKHPRSSFGFSYLRKEFYTPIFYQSNYVVLPSFVFI
jgi:hypothetical protein